MPQPLLALVRPTASGKTDAALAIAERLGAEIVSVDSMTVYRGLDVGTAKASPGDRARVRHHLVDVADPTEEFSVARYQQLARRAIEDIDARGARPLLVGGTGLYFRAVVDELDFPGTDPETRRALEVEAHSLGAGRMYRRLRDVDPVAARKNEPSNMRRTVRALEVAAVTGRPFSSFAEGWDRYPTNGLRAAGVRVDPRALRDRIERRVRAQFEAGLLDETRALMGRGMGPSLTARQAIGYA